MTIEGVEGIYLETHNWGKSVRFLQALGFTLEFSTDHGSGMLRSGVGPYLIVHEVPEDQPVQTQVILKVTDAGAFSPGPAVEVLASFKETHYGTQEMSVRDPDGRVWSLQAPPPQ